MLSLIGLGLADDEITERGLAALQAADIAYAEAYTNALSYDYDRLTDRTGTDITVLDRAAVEEQDRVLDTAGEQDVALLVSGDPVAATTHQDLLFRARDAGIDTAVVHAPSIFTAVAETGLSLYKFGRTTTLPAPYNGSVPDSPFDVIDDNRAQGLHTLLLLDIGMAAETALDLVRDRVRDPVFLCSALGTADAAIRYGPIDALATDVPVPCCLIVPGELSDNERERVDRWL